jgi:signal recognition particle subunit SRP54
MGDVVSLVERAQEQFDEEEARRIQKKIAKTNLVLMIFLPKFNR